MIFKLVRGLQNPYTFPQNMIGSSCFLVPRPGPQPGDARFLVPGKKTCIARVHPNPI